ncbi:protein phosphatase CheZ [Desulfovibrio psychrotolerans]|uniref:Chemotaxis protein CheZ n=1 Tax=Desulfovibrio psychrotolerans TaxID=415242 RepID=A0A7J0BZG1_9BACT|nr:protein phosphatase CheZ [Desulfovibrio psychrotolerans]GFM38354.1 chemotaxis protein CheZ [Desulfovibrio psychrotolerans]
MRAHDQMVEAVMERVSAQVAESIKDVITNTVEQALTTNLTRALLESEFYRRISEDMRDGLQSIYKEISSAAKKENGGPEASPQAQTNQLFSEASMQLDEVRVTLEEATGKIMDVLELQMVLRTKAASHLKDLSARYANDKDVKALLTLEDNLGNSLTDIMTHLSFQDLTGQRIKRIINAIQRIEATVLDLYLSTGLIIKAREENPEEDFDALEAKSKQKVSELKGPTRDASQNDVDDLLAQLGLG